MTSNDTDAMASFVTSLLGSNNFNQEKQRYLS